MMLVLGADPAPAALYVPPVTAARLLVAISCLVACGSRDAAKPSAKSDEPRPSDPRPSPAAPAPPRTRGAAGLPSLPREDWPCRAEGTLPAQSARTVRIYESAGAPASCLHPPDAWLPGCPPSVVMKNLDLDLSTVTTFDFDAKGRVVSTQSGHLPGVDIEWTADDKVSSQGQQLFYQLGPSTVLVELDEESPVARIELDAQRRPVRIESEYDSSNHPQAIQHYAYEGRRLATYRVEESGQLKVDLRFIYDCK